MVDGQCRPVHTAHVASERPRQSSEGIDALAGQLQSALYVLWARFGRSATAEINDGYIAGTQLAILNELSDASTVRVTDLASSPQVRVPSQHCHTTTSTLGFRQVCK